jgi:hypothetical protein
MADIENEEELVRLISEWTDSSKWTVIDSHDLYYWIDCLNKLDSLLEAPDLSDPPTRDRILAILRFTTNLLEKANSRSLYNSCDRMAVLLDSDDPEIVLYALNVLIAVIKVSYFNGKLTQAHEDELLLQKLESLSDGFNASNPERRTMCEFITLSAIPPEDAFKFKVTSPKIQIHSIQESAILNAESSVTLADKILKDEDIDTSFKHAMRTRIFFLKIVRDDPTKYETLLKLSLRASSLFA